MVEKLQQAGVQTQLVDFLELPLPMLNADREPVEFKKTYPDSNVQKWSAIADAADGFIIVTPEYNHGYPSVLKNALDWLYPEYDHKVVGLVGVSSGPVGGARALAALRQVIATLNMFSIRETVMFVKVQEVFDASGKLLDESYNKKIDGLIKSLMFSTQAMKNARESIQK